MKQPFIRGSVIALFLAGALTGCTTSPEFGSIAVEIQAVHPEFPDRSHDIIIRGVDGFIAEYPGVPAGRGFVVEEVPLGQTSIEAVSLCVVESGMSAEHPTMRLEVNEKHCTLTD